MQLQLSEKWFLAIGTKETLLHQGSGIPRTIDKVKAYVERFGGQITNIDEWGKRRLAYEINDRTEGFYYLVNFKADSEFPKELERQYKITEGILRTIVIRKDEEQSFVKKAV